MSTLGVWPPPMRITGGMVAFGAGFACETLLLRPNGWVCAGRA